MKKLIISIVFLIVGLSINTNANTDYAKRVGGYFYTSLSPYGTWIEIGFGTPVWRPTIIRKTWSPYNNGQWIYTDYGWYWDSYEPFGAIVYHYGRWYYDDYYGWIWIPDNEWAPAWVEWRYDDDYIGWAPLSPYALFSVSIGIHYTHNYNIPYAYWNFVKYNHFCDRNVYRYFAAPKYKYRIYERTKIRNNYSYYDGRVRNGGVDYDRIRDRSGRSITKRNLVTVNDLSEISKTRSKNDREIRTYIARREDLARDGLRDIKVERTDRKTSLDLSKVELGRERTQSRTNERNDVNTRERSLDNNNRKNDQNINRDTRKDNNNRINEEKKVQPRNEVKRNSEIQKRNNDLNIQKRNETKKIESRNQNYESRNRNSELKRNESNTRRENRKNENSDSREKVRR